MDVLSHYSSPIVEFPATQPLEKQHALVDNCTGTDPPPPSQDAATGTQEKLHVATQTEQRVVSSKDVEYDERALAKWLRQICPMVERELMNPTPLMEDLTMSQCRLEEKLQVYTYQKLIMGGAENSQGLAIWLCVHTNNAPVLVATTVAPHDDWCEHVDQQLKLFVPQRMSVGNLVIYTEAKTLPLKSCLRSLCTNPFNKTMFAGSTMDGELFIWLYEQARGSDSSVDIKQLYSVSSTQGAAVALDWPREHLLLACFANGSVRQWDLSRQMALDWEYTLPATVSSEPTAMVTLGLDDFVVGTNDGGVYRCWNTGRQTAAIKQIKLLALRRHRFMVSTLLRTEMEGNLFVLSCDLSGQAFYHDMRLVDEDMAQLIVQIPLPFKNVIACSRDGNIIFCPANDGSLEYYRVSDGAHAHVKGGLRGKGSLIRSSDNGRWLIAGLYGDEFQIFYVEH
uniref:Ig-like domain-containing protein n=2 Tax=Drosophila melanogaster TaxID=7227 RepID=Q9VUY2_DROME|nr:uncharacterized protein Dmel_CG13074 [Drosophila melanogaster]AAF49541.1 uncharacterized protein Dmel_CG13074 [Drosophila melanogaster]AOQ14638.1 CG13074-PA [synthetic construct]|eukprot:NP_648835.1 uncharacterized protein Dmel_CG13074 [Drosophila melanogaster]